MTPTNDKVDQSGADENFPVAHQFYEGGSWHNFLNERHHLETVKAGYPIRALYAAPQQAVAASSEPVAQESDDLVDWDRISEAAKQACNEYGQWMPERWLQLFVNAYNRGKS